MIEIVPLTARRMDDLGQVLRGTWGNGCWCMHPRLNERLLRELPGPGGANERRRVAMTALARKRRAPGLLAYADGQPVGWIAVAPRPELVRVEASRVTPRVDDVDVWVIPCITVKKGSRGQGIATAMIEAAVEHAGRHGAPAVEAYPRAGDVRVHDDFAYIGTEALFARAGFEVIRGVDPNLRAGLIPRVTMRRACAKPKKPAPGKRRAR